MCLKTEDAVELESEAGKKKGWKQGGKRGCGANQPKTEGYKIKKEEEKKEEEAEG
jgi:hypothetical protein